MLPPENKHVPQRSKDQPQEDPPLPPFRQFSVEQHQSSSTLSLQCGFVQPTLHRGVWHSRYRMGFLCSHPSTLFSETPSATPGGLLCEAPKHVLALSC